jgi:alpha-beta hydrolase superfamily lysophospholipase
MKSKVSKEQLSTLWEQLESTVGQYKEVKNVKTTSLDEGIKQKGLLQFEAGALEMALSTNAEGKISGLFISQLGYEAPEYAKNLGTGKKYTNFESHGYNIPGELVIPLECNECPLVVLVHGSGPNDKDETIGPNKVFYDLAMGLASKGVATYRYDKRSNIYPETLTGQFDLYDETINDAVSALLHIQKDTSLHFGKYVMLGHSLGAYAMPLIADSLGDLINGAILFSGNSSRLEDLIDYQMEYLTSFDGEISKAEAKIIKENTERAQNIRTNDYTDSTSAELLLGYWPGKFWKGIDNYSPVSTLSANKKMPFFIMQGEKDYQIPMKEYEKWQEVVGTQPNVTMRSYPGLTHLFTPTQAERSSPQDYFSPNNVDFQVIWDMADWVKYVE